jgi:hypothetical protein
MCPQHWSQVANDHFPDPHGNWSYQQGEEFVMEWRQRTLRKTIPWDKRTNTDRFYTAPDTRRYRAFAERFNVKNRTSQKERVCYEAHIDWDGNVISDDETDGGDWAYTGSDEETVNAHNTQRPRAHEENSADLFQNTPGFKARPAAIIDEDLGKLSCQDPQTELLRWHYRLGHLSFIRIKRMAELGILPRKLVEVNPPNCDGCLFGTMTKKPWSNKGKSPKGVGHLATAPGKMVSLEQLESSAAGFISQLKGKLTRRIYKAANIFVDNFSRMSYAHLQEILISADTVEVKEAFEAFSRNTGVRIQHYHADNSIFADNGFMNAVRQNQQTISFCGANAHFQNGIAENRIRDLQEQARTMLLHANSRWPKGVSIHLWPYALRSSN